MQVSIVRHAATKDNEDKLISGSGRDQPLSPNGHLQARNLYWAFAREDIDIVYCSPLLRAQQTSLAIRSQRLGVEELVIPSLTERACGIFEGTSIAPDSPFAKACAAAGKPFGHFAPEGGESLMQVQERTLQFFSTLYEKHADQNIVLVSSGTAIAMLLLGILKREVSIENYHTFKHSNTGFTKLFFSDPETCHIVCLNRTNHL